MVNELFIPKQFNTYTDTFLMLGVAQIAASTLSQIQPSTNIQLIDEGVRYRIQFSEAVDVEAIANLTYTNLFPPVAGKKTDTAKFPNNIYIYDVQENTEKRKLYRDYQYQTGKPEWSEEAPKPPDPRTQNGAILTSMRHDRNHNNLWLAGWETQKNYSAIVTSLFQVLSQPTDDGLTKVAQHYQKITGEKLPKNDSAVKIYFPTAVQGVNRVKADNNKFNSQTTDWLTLWLVAGGLFEFAIAERVKVGERVYDWRVVALNPDDISYFKYREILDIIRKYNPPGGGHGIAKFDAELVLKFCQELLNNYPAKARENEVDELELFWQPINHFISGFSGTHFSSKGQVYGVKDIFKLGLPGWIKPDNQEELGDYLEILDEHLKIIGYLARDEAGELLRKYRDFITSISINQFFPFATAYADYVVKKLADTQARTPRQFSITGLNLMMKKNQDFTKIINDESFLRIAKAINQATVYAGKVKTKDGQIELDWQRQYGLSQQLSSQSGSKKDFICAISDFLGKYESENLRLQEKLEGKPLKRVWPRKEDLDRLIELVEEFDTVVVANLLIAYGYARWSKAKESEEIVSEENER